VARIASVLAVMLVLAGWFEPGTGRTAPMPAPTAASTPSPCDAPLTLVLRPGDHWPGAAAKSVPRDLPPGTITLHLPLYPGAVTTREKEPHPFLSIPATRYIKSASATYLAAADSGGLKSWYGRALAACGYKTDIQGTGGGPGYVSFGMTETRKVGRDQLRIYLSFSCRGSSHR